MVALAAPAATGAPLAALAAAAAVVLAAAAAPPAADAAVLWDLVVTVNVTNAPLAEGEGPAVGGLVVDHAGSPVEGAAVQIRTGHGSAALATGPDGTFAHAFGPQDLLPGEHRVSVVATSVSNRMGAASATFRVNGDLTLSSHTAQLLSTPEAQRYLSADPGDFAGDPIGLRLYHYYQGLSDRMAGESAAQKEIDDARAALDEVRRDADNRTRAALAEKRPGGGTFGGTAHELFISGLDPSIRTVVAQQINFTAGVFEAAQRAMEEVLARGGSLQEARAAYLEAATVPRSVIEDLDLAERYGVWSIVGGLNLSSAATSTTTPPPAAPVAPAPQRGDSETGRGSGAPGSGKLPPAPIPSNSTASPPPAAPPPAAPIPSNSTASPPPAAPIPSNSTASSPPPPPAPPAPQARIEVVQSGTTIVLNINGTMTEFLVNGTSVVAKGP